MTDYTISLSDTLSAFLKQAVEDCGHANESEYITELLSKHRLKQLPKRLSDLEKLQLFNRKAKRLEEYQLWEYLENHPSSVKESEGIISDNLPNNELIEAALMTLRLFMQNNDHISIGNMYNIYDKNPKIPNELKETFVKYRSDLNNFLEQNSLFSTQSLILINEQERPTEHYKNKEILEFLLYGEIAHFTQRKDYEKLYSNPFNSKFNLMQFLFILKKFKNFILVFKEINSQTIPYLE